jgi:hypothetical protein
MTCKQQCVSFQNTADNLQNLSRSLWASFHYRALYHNVNTLDIDLFAIRTHCTNGQIQWTTEGHYYDKHGDIGYKSTGVVCTELDAGFYIRTYPWAHTDIQCLQRPG